VFFEIHTINTIFFFFYIFFSNVANTAGIFDPYFMHFDALFYLIRCGGNIFETGVARATYFGLVS
jgi:hypothetical protein